MSIDWKAATCTFHTLVRHCCIWCFDDGRHEDSVSKHGRVIAPVNELVQYMTRAYQVVRLQTIS
jgi:hypothetical protein